MSLDHLTDDELARAYLALVEEVITNAPGQYALDTDNTCQEGICATTWHPTKELTNVYSNHHYRA